jgi:hypothetical protein
MTNTTNTKSLIRRAGVLATALALMATARDAGAIERKGFIIGLGIGGGQITCDGCESLSGPAFALHLGGMINEKVALVWDSSGVVKEEDGVTLSSAVVGPAVQYWASPRVWVKGGAGAGRLVASSGKVTSSSEWGLGFLGGVGVEAVQKKKFTIDLQARFTTAKIEGERTNNFFALIGFNFY